MLINLYFLFKVQIMNSGDHPGRGDEQKGQNSKDQISKRGFVSLICVCKVPCFGSSLVSSSLFFFGTGLFVFLAGSK